MPAKRSPFQLTSGALSPQMEAFATVKGTGVG